MRTRVSALALAALLSATLVGCGSDDKTESVIDDKKTENTSKSDDTSSDINLDDLDVDDDSAAALEALEAGDWDALVKEVGGDEGCAAIGILSLSLLGMDGDIDSGLMDKAKDKIPGAIKDDLNYVLEAMEGINLEDMFSADADPAMLEKLESPEYEKASDNVSKWSDENCESVDISE